MHRLFLIFVVGYGAMCSQRVINSTLTFAINNPMTLPGWIHGKLSKHYFKCGEKTLFPNLQKHWMFRGNLFRLHRSSNKTSNSNHSYVQKLFGNFDVCSLGFFQDAEQGFPFHSRLWTLRNRPPPLTTVRVRAVWPCLSWVLQKWSLLFRTSRSLVSRGTRGTVWHSNMFHHVSKVVWCGRPNTFASFSEDELDFSSQQHFAEFHHHFVWQARHFRRVVLLVFVNRIVRAASSGDKVQNARQAWHFMRSDENWRKPRTKHRFWGGRF